MSAFLQVFCADIEGAGRFNIAFMTDQTRMELLVADMENLRALKSEDDDFLEIEQWPGLKFGLSGEVVRVQFEPDMLDNDETSHDDDIVDMFVYIVGPRGAMDLRWIPQTVVHFNVASLSIKGTLKTALLPPVLEKLRLPFNKLHGTFQVENLPDRLQSVSILRNEFSGTLDLTALPKNMQYLILGSNDFSGSIDLSRLPGGIQMINVHNTRLSGTIDISHVPSSVRTINVQRTKIRQETVLVPTERHPNFSLRFDEGQFMEIRDHDGNDASSLLTGRRV